MALGDIPFERCGALGLMNDFSRCVMVLAGILSPSPHFSTVGIFSLGFFGFFYFSFRRRRRHWRRWRRWRPISVEDDAIAPPGNRPMTGAEISKMFQKILSIFSSLFFFFPSFLSFFLSFFLELLFLVIEFLATEILGVMEASEWTGADLNSSQSTYLASVGDEYSSSMG